MTAATIRGQVMPPASARPALVGDVSWERMIRSVEKVRERLRRTVAALEAGGVPYALAGGNAVAAWVSRVDETAVRNTQDVDILLRRSDLPAAITAMAKAGFIHRHAKSLESLSENCEGCCGEGFWIGARRNGRSIPAAGCDDRDNEAPNQKTHRPEGYRAKGRLASLLLSRRPTRGILLRRASPYSLLLDNSTSRNFQTGSDMFLDGPDASARDAVHVVFASEKVKTDSIAPAPDVTESEATETFQLVTLDALVRMKLTAFRDKDRTHLRDLIEVGLVDANWVARLSAELAARLQGLLDTPEG